MRRAEPYAAAWKVRPFEEGYRATGGSSFVCIEEMPVVDVVLVHAELHPPKTENFGVEPAVCRLVRSHERDVVKTSDESLQRFTGQCYPLMEPRSVANI